MVGKQPQRTRRKLMFGNYMQSLREGAEPRLSPDQVARQVHTAKSTITRMEGGYTVPGFLLMGTLLGIYGASSDERATAEQLHTLAKADTARVEHIADMPAKYQAFRRDEVDAVRSRTLDTVVIPGLLQTPQYAAELVRAVHRLSKAENIEAISTAERQSRQSMLARPKSPLTLHALIDEAALSRHIGGAGVTTAQLDHLLSMAERRNVTIQVIPLSMGAYGPLSGPMVLLDYEHGPSVAYLEDIAGGETVDSVDDVAALSDVWDEIAATAPSPEESAAIIRRIRNSVNDWRSQVADQ